MIPYFKKDAREKEEKIWRIFRSLGYLFLEKGSQGKMPPNLSLCFVKVFLIKESVRLFLHEHPVQFPFLFAGNLGGLFGGFGGGMPLLDEFSSQFHRLF